MTRKYSNIIEKEFFYEITDLQKFGIRIVLTKTNFKNSMEKSKDEMLELLSEKNKFIASGYQRHTTNIKIYNDINHTFDDNTDGFISSNKDIILYAKFADCLPIFLYDKEKDVWAVLHSGWRGSYESIVIKGLNLFTEEFSSNKEDIIIIFGFGISAKNYEVQKDFYENFKNKFQEDLIKKSFILENGKYYFDNMEFNFNLLIKHGIDKKNIFLNKECTYTNKKLDSYRRDKEKSGRSACFIYKFSNSHFTK